MNIEDSLEARLRMLADMQEMTEDEDDELNAVLAEEEAELDLDTLKEVAAAGPPRMSFKKFQEILKASDQTEP